MTQPLFNIYISDVKCDFQVVSDITRCQNVQTGPITNTSLLVYDIGNM